nr:MAG TPA: hypothetical protein [Caudoviricetes sp.]
MWICLQSKNLIQTESLDGQAFEPLGEKCAGKGVWGLPHV